jgi:RNA polymerase sigma-70 factor (TIGR02960 family)
MESLEVAFERHRRELHVHCYRMLASYDDAEDAVQEAYLRAWRSRDTFQGEHVRAWLYKIATNACLDRIRSRARSGGESPAEVAWLTAYPDDALEPDATYADRETIELAFLVAIQHLAPLPRAVLVLRDVLGCSARETASLLETTEASVNSALQRARAGLRERLPERRAEWAPGAEPSAAERELLDRYVELSERADAQGLAALLHEDVRFTMPPQPGTWVGRDRVVGSWVEGGFGEATFGSMRCVVTRGNGQPAVACYVRRPGDDAYTPLAIDVLRIEEGAVKDITTFDGALLGMFDLPPRL